MPKDLVQIIRDNPGCHAMIDNDYWRLAIGGTVLAEDGDELAAMPGSTYGGDCRYGGALLRAMAVIVGMTVESV